MLLAAFTQTSPPPVGSPSPEAVDGDSRCDRRFRSRCTMGRAARASRSWAPETRSLQGGGGGGTLKKRRKVFAGTSVAACRWRTVFANPSSAPSPPTCPGPPPPRAQCCAPPAPQQGACPSGKVWGPARCEYMSDSVTCCGPSLISTAGPHAHRTQERGWGGRMTQCNGQADDESVILPLRNLLALWA